MRRDYTSSIACQDTRQPHTTGSKAVRLGRSPSSRLIQLGKELITSPACLQDQLILFQLYASNESVLYELIIVRSIGSTKKHRYQQHRRVLTNYRQEMIQIGYPVEESESGNALTLTRLVTTRHPCLRPLDKRFKKLRQNLRRNPTNMNQDQ